MIEALLRVNKTLCIYKGWLACGKMVVIRALRSQSYYNTIAGSDMLPLYGMQVPAIQTDGIQRVQTPVWQWRI